MNAPYHETLPLSPSLLLQIPVQIGIRNNLLAALSRLQLGTATVEGWAAPVLHACQGSVQLLGLGTRKRNYDTREGSVVSALAATPLLACTLFAWATNTWSEPSRPHATVGWKYDTHTAAFSVRVQIAAHNRLRSDNPMISNSSY